MNWIAIKRFLFRRTYIEPEDFSGYIMSYWHDEDTPKCLENLKLSVAESRRYMFSTFILVAMLPKTLAAMQGRWDLKKYLAKTSELNLAYFTKAWPHDEFVCLGDYILKSEYASLAKCLEERFQERVPIENIQNYKIKTETLLAATAFIRGKQLIQDLKAAKKASAPEYKHIGPAYVLGIRLESYIIEDASFERSRGEDFYRARHLAGLSEQLIKKVSHMLTIF